MNKIKKLPIDRLGYGFVDAAYLQPGETEYTLRNKQNNRDNYRKLTSSEKEILIRNGNTADDWSNIFVTGNFDPVMVKNNKFYGLVRIGKLEPYYLEFHNLRMPVGIYNSTIISSDLGDNVCIENANYLSHYIVGNEVMISNVNEMATTDYAKFGNGILKEGEAENVRIWMEIRNENGGRPIIPFDDMLPGDAWLWSNHPEDDELMEKLKEFTAKKFDSRRGYYGTIGDRCVIKDCDIIKDVKMGSDAYVKGANKLKNLTINSDEERNSQIGEGCELVNGIVGFGSRIFYGVKAVRFVMDVHSQLKYGARLLNSYLGSNSTISCCEVLNSLIFPSHEQHHNNSFLCASFLAGQSNIAAGATLGSNHNSRAADGEIIAGRGFWPGLCVSLKHNSRFASFTILSKSDFPHELNIFVPFCLVSNDVANNKLVIMPAYWFLYNMYAMTRNSWKYKDRDKRVEGTHFTEYDFLAPDTVNEMMEAIKYLNTLEVNEAGNAEAQGFENSHRKTEIVKVPQAIETFQRLIRFYCIRELFRSYQTKKDDGFEDFKRSLRAQISREEWKNVGGQLMPAPALKSFIHQIRRGQIESWEAVHSFYLTEGGMYANKKLSHAYTTLLELEDVTPRDFTPARFADYLEEALQTRRWICDHIYESRAKDYQNPFKRMIYENQHEMDAVVGRIEDNPFIQQQFKELDAFEKEVQQMKERLLAQTDQGVV